MAARLAPRWSARKRVSSKIAWRWWWSTMKATVPISAVIRETMTKMNLARRLPRISCTTRRGDLVKTKLRACRRLLLAPSGRRVGTGLAIRLNTGYGLSCTLCRVLLEPDFLHRDGPVTQKTDLYPIHIGSIQAFKDVVVLGNPGGIFHDDALYIAVERDPTRIVDLLAR